MRRVLFLIITGYCFWSRRHVTTDDFLCRCLTKWDVTGFGKNKKQNSMCRVFEIVLIRISKKPKHGKTNFHVQFAVNSINPVCRKINLHVRSGMEIDHVMSFCQMRVISKSREIGHVRCGKNWNGRQRSGTVFLGPKTKSIRIPPLPAIFARALRFESLY